MILANFTVKIFDFNETEFEMDPKYKAYSIGLWFEASVIEEKINSIFRKFFRTFLTLFLMPFMITVVFFLIAEVIFIVFFSNRIFRTIKDLYDKIEILSQQHRLRKKTKKRMNNNNNSFDKSSPNSTEADNDLDDFRSHLLDGSSTVRRRRASTKTKSNMLGASGDDAQGNLDVL